MGDLVVDSLERRVSRLTAIRNSLGIAVVASLLLATAATLMALDERSQLAKLGLDVKKIAEKQASGTFQSVKASIVELTDGRGEVAGTLSADGVVLPYSGSVVIKGPDNKDRVTLSFTGLDMLGGGFVSISDAHSRTSLGNYGLSVQTFDSAIGGTGTYSANSLSLDNQDRTKRVMLLVDGPTLSISSEHEYNAGFGIDVDKDFHPRFYIDAAKNATTGSFSLGGSGLRLLDEQGNVRLVVGASKLESTETGSQETTAISSIALFDKAGKLFWRQP